jgi:hypothetical protein
MRAVDPVDGLADDPADALFRTPPEEPFLTTEVARSNANGIFYLETTEFRA